MSVVDKYSNSDSSVTMILSHNNITKKIWYTPTVLEQEKKIERNMDNNMLEKNEGKNEKKRKTKKIK